MKPARILSVVFLAAVALFLLWQEPKTGRVEGVATLKADGRPLAFARVELQSTDEDNYQQMMTKTDARGRFTLRAVPVGEWMLSVYGEHHRVDGKKVVVSEARSERVDLALTRNQPDLNVAEARQPVFTSRETPFLPVQGYGEASDKLTVAVSKTRLSAVLAQPGASEQLSRMSATYEGAMPDFPAAVAASGPAPLPTTSVKVSQPDREGFFVQRLKLPISKVEPGIYFVKVTHGKKSVVSWALVTNTALVLKTPPQGEALAYVADLVSGEPVAGAKVSSLGGSGTLTDKDGLARVSLTGVQRLVVTRGTDEATLQVSRSESENSGGLVVHAWTDRTIYRPGHTVAWKAVLRKRDSQASRAYAIPSGLPATVTVLDARGGEVSKKAMTASVSGSLDGSFEISPESETGAFTLKIEAGGETYAKDITVAAYRKPEFEASATPAKSAYVLGERAEFSVSAKYYFGAPVAGAKVTWQVYREGDWAAGAVRAGPLGRAGLRRDRVASGRLLRRESGRWRRRSRRQWTPEYRCPDAQKRWRAAGRKVHAQRDRHRRREAHERPGGVRSGGERADDSQRRAGGISWNSWQGDPRARPGDGSLWRSASEYRRPAPARVREVGRKNREDDPNAAGRTAFGEDWPGRPGVRRADADPRGLAPADGDGPRRRGQLGGGERVAFRAGRRRAGLGRNDAGRPRDPDRQAELRARRDRAGSRLHGDRRRARLAHGRG